MNATSGQEPPVEPPDVRASYRPRCPECDFAIDEHEPRVLTAFGFCHVLCAPDEACAGEVMQ